MEKENFQIQNNLYSHRFSDPKIVIFLFIFIIVFIPFYESKRVLIWSTQRENQNENIFRSVVAPYAFSAEKIKGTIGLDDFFERERYFWLGIKDSPLIFQEEVKRQQTINPAPFGGVLDSTERILSNCSSFSPQAARYSERCGIKTKEDLTEEEKNILREEPKEGDTGEIQAEGEQEQAERKQTEGIAGIRKEETKTELLPAEKIEAPFRILIIGDSLIAVWGGLGEILEGTLITYKDTKVLRYGKVSSGLSRPDYFDWNLKTTELLSQFQPNIIIIMLGLNDAQTLTNTKGETLFVYGNEKWKEGYGERVRGLPEIFKENNITVFWLGLPVMRSKIFSEKMKNLNSIYEKEAKNFENAYFISTWELLTDKDGNYTSYLPDEKGTTRLVRNSDGIHLSYIGGQMTAKEIIKEIERVLKLEKK